MKTFGSLAPTLAVVLLAAAPAGLARDVYRGFLDPAVPHHEAIASVLAKLEKTPGDPRLKNDLGCLVAWDGFWRDALREFDEAADLDRAFSRPAYNAGLVRAWKGEWRSAVRSFRTAVKRDPGNWPAWWMLGFSEEMLGNVNAAVEAYKTSLRVDTSLFDVKTNPFAVQTRLKTRVLLETYEKRMVRAALPSSEQFADPATLGVALHRSAPASRPGPAAGPLLSEPEVEGHSGPIVSSVPASSSAPARGASSSSSSSASSSRLRRGRDQAPATTGAPLRTEPRPTGNTSTPLTGLGGAAPVSSSASPGSGSPGTTGSLLPGGTPVTPVEPGQAGGSPGMRQPIAPRPGPGGSPSTPPK